MEKANTTLGEIVGSTPFNLWAFIAAIGYAIGRFARWFVLRERIQFWKEVDVKIKNSADILKEDMDAQFASIQKYLSQAIHGKNNHIAARDGVINESNEAMLKALNTIEKLRTELEEANARHMR